MRGELLGPPVTALEGIYGNAVVGSDGRLHIVALNGGPLGAFGSADQKVEYRCRRTPACRSRSRSRSARRDEMLPFFFSNPSVAVDDARHWIYVAYARGGRDAVWDIVIAASKDGGKTWKRQTIGDGCAIHMVPNLALDARTGTLHVAYYDSEGAPRFAHATCTPGAAKCTVKGAINATPFAALSTERHGTKWIGEYESLVIDDKRRVLHAVWTQPVDGRRQGDLADLPRDREAVALAAEDLGERAGRDQARDADVQHVEACAGDQAAADQRRSGSCPRAAPRPRPASHRTTRRRCSSSQSTDDDTPPPMPHHSDVLNSTKPPKLAAYGDARITASSIQS